MQSLVRHGWALIAGGAGLGFSGRGLWGAPGDVTALAITRPARLGVNRRGRGPGVQRARALEAPVERWRGRPGGLRGFGAGSRGGVAAI